MCRGKFTFLLRPSSWPSFFFLTGVQSSSHKWLRGCPQARLPCSSFGAVPTRGLEEQPCSPAACPPSSGYYF